MSSTPVPILPDDIILEIFKRLPLQDLFNGIRPIRCWRLILQCELNRRKTLYLYSDDTILRWDYPYRELLDHVRRDDGPAWPETLPTCSVPNEAQLKFACLPMYDEVERILQRNPFPNITNLTVRQDNITLQRYNDTIQLIQLWSPKLIWLRLDLSYQVPSVSRGEQITHQFQTMILPLFETLNNMPTLRHLYLKFNCASWLGGNQAIYLPDNLRFSFLSQLHTFCFKANSNDEPMFNRRLQCLFTSLREHAIENEHLRICFHHNLYMKEALKLGLQLNSKFIQIKTYSYKEKYIQAFCMQFSSLSRLTLDCDPYMMSVLSQHLRLLPSLFSLKLIFVKEPLFERPVQEEEEEYDDDQPIAEPEHYYQVASVRVLRLKIETISHANIGALHIADIFPNLQVLRLWHTSCVCSQCEYSLRIGISTSSKLEKQLNPELRNKITECKRLARRPFGACASLRIIEYNDDPFHPYYPKLISADQLRIQ